MALIDDYSQDMNTQEWHPADEATVRRRRDDLQRQVTIVDSDLKKIIREIEEIEIEKRRLKKETERIRVDADELDKKSKKLDNDRRFLEEQLQNLRKKLKTLR
jgi:chromosome segregation ATPase